MADLMCAEAMELLNVVFKVPLILNDGHEIFQRLEAGDEMSDIIEDLGRKFGRPDKAAQVLRVVENWDPLHIEALSELVRWALSKLDTDDRIQLQWKGDATASETVTRFELRGHTLLIEFAHPPAALQPAATGAAQA